MKMVKWKNLGIMHIFCFLFVRAILLKIYMFFVHLYVRLKIIQFCLYSYRYMYIFLFSQLLPKFIFISFPKRRMWISSWPQLSDKTFHRTHIKESKYLLLFVLCSSPSPPSPPLPWISVFKAVFMLKGGIVDITFYTMRFPKILIQTICKCETKFKIYFELVQPLV